MPGPFDCWLVLRGIKTLALRMRQHCENARAIAAFLDGHDAVERVLYPGPPRRIPGHEIARAPDARLRRDGLVPRRSRRRRRSRSSRGRRSSSSPESLGGVESLIEHPARMTHASTADAPFAAPRNLVRLSVGIESADDLIADLEPALVRPASRVAPSSR